MRKLVMIWIIYKTVKVNSKLGSELSLKGVNNQSITRFKTVNDQDTETSLSQLHLYKPALDHKENNTFHLSKIASS